jgi:hypothetical protein
MLGRTHSEESKKKISDSKKGAAQPLGTGKPSQSIEVTDIKKNTKTIYDSISAAARALDIPGHRSLQYSLTTGKAYKKRYTFKKL